MKNYTMRIDILNMLQRFLVIFTTVSIIIMVFTKGDAYIWKSLPLFLASILSFVIDKFSKHIWSYLILHLMLIAGFVFIAEDIVLRVIFGLYIFIFALLQFALTLNKKVHNTTLFSSVIIIGMYLLCIYLQPENTLLRNFIFYLAIAYGLMYIMNMYFINFHIYLKKYEDRFNIPIKQIKSSNGFFLTAFLCLSFIAMMLFSRLPLGYILQFLGKWIVKAIRFVFSLFASKPQEEVAEPVQKQAAQAQDLFGVEAAEPSAFWLLVSKIIYILCIAAIVILAISLVIYGLYRIYKLYYAKKVLTDIEEKVENISPFEKSSLGKGALGSSVRRGILSLFGKSNNDKIRKQYQKAVQRNTNQDNTLKYKTPAQLSGYAVDTGNKQANALTRQEKEAILTTIYEKARYSNTECSKEDVQSVKNLLK